MYKKKNVQKSGSEVSFFLKTVETNGNRTQFDEPSHKRAYLKNESTLDIPFECNVVLPISIGYPYHEDEDLKATIKLLLAKKEFSSVTIIIADILQRFTKALTNEGIPEKYINEAKEEGEGWLSRNNDTVLQLGNKLKNIFFWEKYLYGKGYTDKKSLVDTLYKKDEIFKAAVENTIEQFLKRRLKRFNFQETQGTKTSEFPFFSREYNRGYILEECAVLLLWQEEKYNFIIYPHEVNQPMQILLQRFIYNDNPNLLKTASIKFKPIKAGGLLCKAKTEEQKLPRKRMQ